MITITIDEAFAYDLLAIASIKAVRNPTNAAANDQVNRLSDEVSKQVGSAKHYHVLGSREYAALRKVNDEIYVRVDVAKARGEQVGDHRYVDDRVYQRWLCKQALQARWFAGEGLAEQKFGYTAEHAVSGGEAATP